MFLLAATLRPETMYGQTNCWALPGGQYGVYRGPGKEAYVMAARSARNYSFQVPSDMFSLSFSSSSSLGMVTS